MHTYVHPINMNMHTHMHTKEGKGKEGERRGEERRDGLLGYTIKKLREEPTLQFL